MIIKPLKDKPSAMFSFQGFSEKGNLVLKFNGNEATYIYKTDMPLRIGFLRAESRGRFFLANIKGKVDFKRVDAK